jgi:hypothetical protein
MTTGGLGVKHAAGRRGWTAIARSRGQPYGPALFMGPDRLPDLKLG